jgi:hypothetical protein
MEKILDILGILSFKTIYVHNLVFVSNVRSEREGMSLKHADELY